MNAVLLRVGALIATFTFAAATNSILNRVYPRFENVAVGEMTIPPNGHGGFSSFRSRDGTYLIFEEFGFPDHESANVAFQNILRGAERTVEREVLHDRDGKLVTGERVVITFRAESGVGAAAVVSLDDTRLYEIASTSLRHAPSFERAHRRY
jgi:hypothetical protein